MNNSPFQIMFSLVPCGLASFGMIFYMFIMMMLFAVGIGITVLWIWMIVDALQRDIEDFPSDDPNQRLIWILLIVFGQWIGALLYYLLVYRKGK